VELKLKYFGESRVTGVDIPGGPVFNGLSATGAACNKLPHLSEIVNITLRAYYPERYLTKGENKWDGNLKFMNTREILPKSRIIFTDWNTKAIHF